MAVLYDERQTYIVVGDNLSTLQNISMFPQDTLYPNQNNQPIYPEDVLVLTENIVQGTMDLDERIADGDLELGKLFSAKFECDVYNVSTTLTGKFIFIYQTPWIDEDSEETEIEVFPVFFGYIDSCTSDRLGTDYHIIAYDLAYYYGKINVASWWNSWWNTYFDLIWEYQIGSGNNFVFEVMLENALKDCLNHYYIEHSFSLPTNYKKLLCYGVRTIMSGGQYNKIKFNHTEFNTLYLSDLIESICQLAIVQPRFDRTGVFRVIDLLNVEPSTSTPEQIDIDGNYDKASLNVSEENAITYDTTKVSYTDNTTNTNTEYSYTDSSGDGSKIFDINNNVILLGLRPYLNNIIETGIYSIAGLIQRVEDITIPLYNYNHKIGSVDILISLSDDILGQKVIFTTDDNELISLPVLHTEYKDSQLITQTVEATGTSPKESDTENSVSYAQETNNEQLDTVTEEVEEIKSTLSTCKYQNISNKALPQSTYTDILSVDLSAGTYQVSGYCWFISNSTGYRQLIITDTSQGSSGIRYGFNVRSDASQTGGTTLVISNVLELDNDTTIYLVGYQNGTPTSPYTLNVNATLSYIKIK